MTEVFKFNGSNGPPDLVKKCCPKPRSLVEPKAGCGLPFWSSRFSSFFTLSKATAGGGVSVLHDRSSGFVLKFSGSELSSDKSAKKKKNVRWIC